MSQIQTFITGMGPGGPILTLSGDIGPAVGPDGAGNITIEGAGNTTYGFGLLTSIATAENPVIGANTLQVIPLFDTVTTNNAAQTFFAAATFAIPVNTSVVMSAHVIGNIDDYSAACGGYTVGCARRAAAGAIIVGNNTLASEDAPAGIPTFGIDLNGNSINVYVRGVAAEIWNWTCTFTFQVQLL